MYSISGDIKNRHVIAPRISVEQENPLDKAIKDITENARTTAATGEIKTYLTNIRLEPGVAFTRLYRILFRSPFSSRDMKQILQSLSSSAGWGLRKEENVCGIAWRMKS
ncbi:hypothetical protein ACJRO7_010979 [Eucalyptus globulus]|uniref:Uncharacterized protein n=1 Tax=Eucalyptus globulus TaxID=34317 RepID=A0ABD3LDR4_EUCGL